MPYSRQDPSSYVVTTVSYVFLSIFAVVCILPFVLIIVASFTSEAEIMRNGYSVWPKTFSTEAYRMMAETPKFILGSYAVSIMITAVGTAGGLLIVSMTGYVLQRRDFRLRNPIALFIYFTTLFNAGMLPFYLLMVNLLRLKDSYLAVILPLMVSPWLIILMRNYMKAIPHSITESAKMDGASDVRIFLELILPLAKPGLATVGLFLALGYWNEWYMSILFLSRNVEYRPLPLYLHNLINLGEEIAKVAAQANIPLRDLPSESLKMATAVVTILPVIFFYPYAQRYFIRGISIGAVKG
jgi:putative aldouronate transport system permease protein